MTLEQLCADLGPELIEVVLAPRGVDVPIAGVTLHDPLDPIRRDEEGDRLLFAVGFSFKRDDPTALMREVAAAAVPAIAFRGAESWPRDLVSAAEETGVALLGVPGGVDWGELYQLIRAAVDARDTTEAGYADGLRQTGLGDLFALAEATAAIAGGPVTIEDMQSRILAFSGGSEIDEGRREAILNRQVPERWLREIRELGVIEHLLTSKEVLHVELGDIERRRVVAIRLGESVLGSIWLAGEDEALSSEADEALRQAAAIAGLQIMRQRVIVNVERRLRESRVAALLWGEASSVEALRRMGISGEDPLVVLALEIASRQAASPATIGPRLIDLLAMHLRSYEHLAVTASREQEHAPGGVPRERIYVLTSCRGPADKASLKRLLGECVTYSSKTLGVNLRAGIGQEVEGPQRLPQSRRTAEESLVLGAEVDAVTTFEDVRARALLADVDAFVSDWHAGRSEACRLLFEHDEVQGTEYVLTFRCLLDALGNVSVAARRLHVHVNTVRYRLKRITEITGVDLEDSEARLALELELRARQLQP
ncbi:MAG TPA: helix-turn-helix domain-containing protein [Solirubrobacterales bacterium]|nr:helix-turn-helix domain-containing protein [Solirubrobacterales bacterium]